MVAALERGRTSWTGVLDAIHLGPDDDEAKVTAAQVREVITRLIDPGHWRDGDPPALVIFDAGYDPMRLAYQPTDMPVEILGCALTGCCPSRCRPASLVPKAGHPVTAASSRFLTPPPGQNGARTTTMAATRYGAAMAQAWDRLHPG